jgi:hypothetical protein
VLDIGVRGVRLLRRNEELFLSYDDFPWFKDQPKRKIENVAEVSPGHFHWPEIDVDLCLESIRDPEKFPLKART